MAPTFGSGTSTPESLNSPRLNAQLENLDLLNLNLHGIRRDSEGDSTTTAGLSEELKSLKDERDSLTKQLQASHRELRETKNEMQRELIELKNCISQQHADGQVALCNLRNDLRESQEESRKLHTFIEKRKAGPQALFQKQVLYLPNNNPEGTGPPVTAFEPIFDANGNIRSEISFPDQRKNG